MVEIFLRKSPLLTTLIFRGDYPPILARSAEAARFRPMRELTLSMQGQNFDLTTPCIAKAFLPQALQAPRRFDEVVPLDTACNSDLDLRPSALFDPTMGNPTFVLQQMLHVNSIREYAIFADFFAPLIDMDVALAGSPVRAQRPPWQIQTNLAEAFDVLTRAGPACNANPSFGNATTNRSEELYNAALINVNAALAQQYLLSGAAIAVQTARLLKDPANDFGRGEAAFYRPVVGGSQEPDKRIAWDAFAIIAAGQATGDLNFDGAPTHGGAAPNVERYEELRRSWLQTRLNSSVDDKAFGQDCQVEKNYALRPYETTACVLSANPTFANNVLQALLLEHLREPLSVPAWATAANAALATQPERSSSIEQYQALLSVSGDSPLFQQTLGRGLPVIYLKGRRPGWFLELRKHTGEYWYWRLPEASLLASAHIYYPLSEGTLREAQALLTSRLGDYAASCSTSGIRDDAKLLSRSAVFAPPRKPLAQEH